MKNPKNKFIIFVISIIVMIIGYVVSDIMLITQTDRNSYVVLLDGKASLNNTRLFLEKKSKLELLDKIETIGKDSLAVIKWGDGSITRMGGDSSVIIKETSIDKDLLDVKIGFELNSGKTWSNVISFIGEDSYFHQEFSETTAAVRGTVFEVNLEKDYLYVEAHEVQLTKNTGKTQIVSENTPFVISTFSFTSLIKFIKEIKDDNFRKLNIKLDKEFYNNLLLKVGDLNDFTTSSISNISELSLEKKEELYNEALSEYQKLNFINSSDIQNYKKKLELKKSLIELSNTANKENLLITTLYDFKDLASNKQFEELKDVVSILSDNKDLLKTLDVNLYNYINPTIIDNLKIPEGLKKEFDNNFNSIKNTLNLYNINLKNNGLYDSAKKSLDDMKGNFNNLVK